MQIYLQVHNRGQVSLPKVAHDLLGLDPGDWVRLSAIGQGRLRLEPVTPDVVEALAWPDGRRPAPAAGEGSSLVHVYVQVHRNGRVCVPKVVRDVIGLAEGAWVVLTDVGRHAVELASVADDGHTPLGRSGAGYLTGGDTGRGGAGTGP